MPFCWEGQCRVLYICSVPFRNLRFLEIPKKLGLSTESAALSTENTATERAKDPALSTTTYYDITGYSVARILSRATIVLGLKLYRYSVVLS